MKESTSNFLLGFLAGAAAGALAGILFAPEKGSETRKNIRRKALEFSGKYGLGLDELLDELGVAGDKASPEAPSPKKKRKYTRKNQPKTNEKAKNRPQ